MGEVDLYDYTLPPELIAQDPLPDRSASRLLVLNKNTGAIQDRTFKNASDYLREGDLLVVNRTRVTALRLLGHRILDKADEGGAVEFLLLKKSGDNLYEVLCRPAKRLRPGSQILFDKGLTSTIVDELPDGIRRVSFSDESLLESASIAPLPPYIKRSLSQRERYQTVYAKPDDGKFEGSAAAPTAGLHFTDDMLESLKSKGVQVAEVSLEIGLDTFRPLQVEHLSEHVMHGERCTLPPETAEAIEMSKGRIIAVGTTTARTLETFARQEGSEGKHLIPGTTESRLFLTPENRFRLVNGMFTNFHFPKTTMLVMLSALTNREFVMNAYGHAVENRYRFLSFGDSMLIAEI